MKVAVTGSAGLIGQALISFLNEKVESVLALDMKEQSYSNHCVRAVKTQCSYDELRTLFQGYDSVVHLASQKATRDNEDGGISAYFSSLAIAENTYKAAVDAGIKNIISISSRCVYGTFTETAFSEEDPTFPINYYGILKIAVEKLSEYYNRHFGTMIKTLRLSQVISGNMSERNAFSVFYQNAEQNKSLQLIGKDIRDYIYIKDVCRAVFCAISSPEKKGIYNIGSGIGRTNKDLAENIINELGSSSEIVVCETDRKPERIILDCRKAAKDLSFSCCYQEISDMIRDIRKEKEEAGR